MSLGMMVEVTTDALPKEILKGRVTAVNPLVDAETRQMKVQATVANRGEKLRPGMFVNVTVGLPERRKVLAIPATAALYAPYGDSVFVVEDAPDKKGKVRQQQFVRRDLPPEAEVPVINVESADSEFASAYLSFTSDILEQNEITDYLMRVVQPRLSAVAGVQRADILEASAESTLDQTNRYAAGTEDQISAGKGS